MSGIFATEALQYWNRNYSPIPLKPQTKEPEIKQWSGFCDNLPKPERRIKWISKFNNSGIGLCCGTEVMPDFRLVGVDVDDDRVVRAVAALIGSPCAKRGKKGLTLFVRSPKSDKLKSTTLYDPEKNGVIDMLASGKQTALPPSIHPLTGVPYVWWSKTLLEVDFADLPVFDTRKFQILKTLVGSEEAWQITTGKTTHDPALRLVGKLLRAGAADAEITALVGGLLPEDYAGNTLDELPGMIASAREKGFAFTSDLPRDDAVAQEVAEELKPVVYLEGAGFLQYKDGYWPQISDNSIDRLPKSFLRPRLSSKQQVAPHFVNVRRCMSLDVEEENFGLTTGLICVENGTVDVHTGALLPHSPDHQLRFKLGIDYHPEADCPIYDEHIRRTLCDDEAAIAVFDEFAGMSLVPDLRYQKALYLLGPGGSGKSKLLGTIMSMHDPRGISVTPLDKIDDERYRTDLAKKLVCISPDVQTNNRVFGETFIRITGGDPVAARKLYAEVDGFVEPTVRFIGSMNLDMPGYIGAPDALERRLIFLRCGPRVENPDPLRGEKLLAERPGILLRWINAYRRLVERGSFLVPETSQDEVSNYLHAHQPFDAFFVEKLIVDPEAKTPVADVGRAFNRWAEEHGERPMATNVVGYKLRRLGVTGDFDKQQIEEGKKTIRTVGVRFRRPDWETPLAS